MNNNRLKSIFLYIFFMMPAILIYFYIFISSMSTAQDREGYLTLMDPAHSGRIEPLLPLLSRILDLIISNHFVKLVVIQLIFICLLIKTLYNYFKPINFSSLIKSILALAMIFAICSNYFSVQLRMGYASVLFVYIISIFDKEKFNLYLLIPILMHYGSILSVLFYIYFSIFKINNARTFIIHSTVMLTSLTLVVMNIDLIFSSLGVSSYYNMYLNDELEFGRLVPYTSIFYLLNCLYLLVFQRKYNDELYYWFSLSGIWLVYTGFFLDFYIAFKMLTPIMVFTIIYTVKNLTINKSYIPYILIIYLITPIAFYYLSKMAQIELL